MTTDLRTDVFLAYVRSFILPEKLGGRKTGFTSTGSITSAMNERSKENRASLPRRLWIVIVHHLAWVHLLFILAIVAGVILTLLRCFLPDGLERIRSAYVIGNAITTHDKLIYLVTRLGWPPLFWLQSTVSAMTPFVRIIVLLNIMLCSLTYSTGIRFLPAHRARQRRAAGPRSEDWYRVPQRVVKAPAENQARQLEILAWCLCDPVHLGTVDQKYLAMMAGTKMI